MLFYRDTKLRVNNPVPIKPLGSVYSPSADKQANIAWDMEIQRQVRYGCLTVQSTALPLRSISFKMVCKASSTGLGHGLHLNKPVCNSIIFTLLLIFSES